MSIRVLLVEDDAALRRALAAGIEAEGWRVQTSASLSDAQALLAHSREPFDLVVLDLGLPDGDGGDLLHDLRRRTATPLLVISARPDEGRKIDLLDAGADDYLTKPFGIGELLARMRVALRHRGRQAAPAVRRWQAGRIAVDLDLRDVRLNGQSVHLTPHEYALLARLVRDAGRVVTHRQLLTDVWGPEHVADTHYLRLYMGQLRTKLEGDASRPRHLLTVTGVGYRLADDDAEVA